MEQLLKVSTAEPRSLLDTGRGKLILALLCLAALLDLSMGRS
jgi:hypothetical protein